MKPAAKLGLLVVLALRAVFGAGLVVAPGRLSRRWLGPLDDPAAVALRGLGAREVSLHSLALASAVRGLPIRPLLAASIAGDMTDIAATAAGRRGLPAGSARATVLVAGVSAAISAGAAALAER